jgi:hypothetical protein
MKILENPAKRNRVSNRWAAVADGLPLSAALDMQATGTDVMQTPQPSCA